MEGISSAKAMITPGVAGSTTTMITGTLVNIFQFPGAETALVISFLFGALIFTEKAVAILFKLIFYIINSMTIFSVAVGLNQAGMAIGQNEKPVVSIERTLASNDNKRTNTSESEPFFKNWF